MRAMRLCLITPILCVTVAFVGCSRTRVGGFTDSQDKKHRVYVTAWGAYGRAFNDQTAKEIRIRIVASGGNERLLLEKSYHVTASSLDWNVAWDEHNNLSVAFFDYGPGVDSSDGQKSAEPKRPVHAVTYRFDPTTASFTEQSIK